MIFLLPSPESHSWSASQWTKQRPSWRRRALQGGEKSNQSESRRPNGALYRVKQPLSASQPYCKPNSVGFFLFSLDNSCLRKCRTSWDKDKSPRWSQGNTAPRRGDLCFFLALTVIHPFIVSSSFFFGLLFLLSLSLSLCSLPLSLFNEPPTVKKKKKGLL